MSHTLCVIPGDGVGKEVIPAAVEVLQKVLPDLQVMEAEAGWDCFTHTGDALPAATREKIAICGAALFGATSSPSRKVEGYRSPIVHMRQLFDLYANLRPTRLLKMRGSQLAARPNAVDLLLVRENTQGLYAGREYLRETPAGPEAIAERVITKAASERVAKTAFALAEGRRKQLCIVHKANILPLTDGTFRDAARAVGAAHPGVKVSEMLVDTAAMLLASRPEQFDMIVTTNLFGDILSDIASVWGGGMGVAPALNLGAHVAVAEPVHGSAPDIAGKGIANPCGAILSAALLARHYWNLPEVATKIENAVYTVLENGLATPDLGGHASTAQVAQEILGALG
ncbi:MAG TPA: isocitrate/isopropylmalate dehydrogenase family protein [Thermoflexales bacterium]|nr:isocitrate/isopropylmalate dehydrogenase family protein [Thermoflexales bacterium]